MTGPFRARLVEREQLAPDIIACWLRAPEIARAAQPGQFVNIRPTGALLLRRPISIAQQLGDSIRLIFRVVGPGTAGLGASQPGDEWDLLGPLGRPAPEFHDRNLILVGGGIGIAPLLFLAERAKADNRLRILLGARNRRDVILRPEFLRLGVKPAHATDDGSLGRLGPVTELLSPVLDAATAPVVFACGPRAMLRRVKELCGKVEAWAFWEERMGCGTGICYGCAVKRADGKGYIRFCREGPVLDMKEIEL